MQPPNTCRTSTCSDHHNAAAEVAVTFVRVQATALIETPLKAVERREHRAAGEMLFMEGESPAGVYVLHEGDVELVFSPREGQPKPLRVVNPGRILGLSSVVMQHPHDCSAVARTDCEVGFVEREAFLRSLEKTPAIWLSVLRMLSNDVNSVYDDMRSLAIG
ncbi:MAG: cyclic nucleotide-binding domain-containing protein [Acidobacteria bacterium]|nr:cyclic nucleotide-binding domain-containing protein [Acidobacteriota bacterium]